MLGFVSFNSLFAGAALPGAPGHIGAGTLPQIGLKMVCQIRANLVTEINVCAFTNRQ
jgi:hypothetical protein